MDTKRAAGPPIVLTIDRFGLRESLSESGYRAIPWPVDAAGLKALLAGEVSQIAALVTTGPSPLPSGLLEAASNLELICCFGAGYENYDPSELAAQGIRLTNAPGVNAEDVADLAIGLLLAARRRLVEADQLIRLGKWPRSVFITSRNRGRKLGILGLGAIGRVVAARAECFGMSVGWHGPTQRPSPWRYLPGVVELAAWADDLVIACRATPHNNHIVDEEVLAALGSDGIVVNVARGSLLDEWALIDCLKSGAIAAAGLDVFAEEPTDPLKWEGVPNITLYPHAGGATHEALEDGKAVVLENLRRHFAREPLLTPVN